MVVQGMRSACLHNATRTCLSALRDSDLARPLVSGFSTALSSRQQQQQQQENHIERVRNIGIIAHIDAGKTTTTERMLYYSGFTRRLGDVDEGSTVTDFLPAERARGITIQSAAVTFHWPPPGVAADETISVHELEGKPLPRSAVSHTINLIDTPGHADFTFEVMRSLRILDGAVCILDGVAGVEAQTEQVWRQASVYRIPRIIFVNKLDRDGAAFGRTVREVGSRLGGIPAVCQIPNFRGGTGPFIGMADVISLKALRWDQSSDGKSVTVLSLGHIEREDPRLADELKRARTVLVELLSEHDETMVERFLECDEDHLAVAPLDILKSLRTCLLKSGSRIIPVFGGASFRNMGVQPLLDAVANLLPSPPETADPEVGIAGVKGGLRRLLSGDLPIDEQVSLSRSGNNNKKRKKSKSSVKAVEPGNIADKLLGCALAFKVVNDARRGVLVYVRVYSGSLDRNCLLFNTNLNVAERAPRLLKMYANDAVEVESIPVGHIAVIVGLKQARTGDTLISYAGNKSRPPWPLDSLQLRPIDVPPPVFFTSIEPHSLGEEKRLEESLALLLREDPSLHVTVDEDSGQTLLSGMGELHLEIARDRLIGDFKAKACMGSIEIGYRESVLGSSGVIEEISDRELAGRKSKAGCMAVVEPFQLGSDDDVEAAKDVLLVATHNGNRIVLLVPGLEKDEGAEENESLPGSLDADTVRNALYNGCLAALVRGPQFAFPMHNTKVTVTFDLSRHVFGNETNSSSLSAAARLAVQSALRDVCRPGGPGTALMEPVMNVVISVDEASLGSVVHDISSSRGGHIVSLDEDNGVFPLSGEDEGVMIDPSTIYAPPDPFEAPSSSRSATVSANQARTISAKVPLKEMVGYLKHLRSLTSGRGTFVMSIDRFENMAAQRQKAVLAGLRGTLS